MAGGRRRKPHVLRVLEGGLGHSRPLTPDLPAPTDPLLKPRGLTRAESASWDEHLAWIRQLRTESAVDAGQFLAMVRYYCRAQRADRAVARYGLTMRTRSNGLVQRPEVAISERCTRLYTQLADKFGMSPQARTKLGHQPEKPESASDLPADLRDAGSA